MAGAIMTDDQVSKIQHGTSVRIKMPGNGGVAGYSITTTKRVPYRVQGNWWVSLEGMGPRPLKDVEVIPAAGDPAGATQASPAQSPYYTPWERLVGEMGR